MSTKETAKDLHLREGTNEDLDLLANLNKELVEDEKQDNKLDITQLKERMRSFMQAGHKYFIFEITPRIIGYCLVDITRDPVYLKQFFICRGERLKGFGQACFQKLFEKLNVNSIDAEVLAWNTRGIKFWKSLGFQDRSIYMRYSKLNIGQ